MRWTENHGAPKSIQNQNFSTYIYLPYKKQLHNGETGQFLYRLYYHMLVKKERNILPTNQLSVRQENIKCLIKILLPLKYILFSGNMLEYKIKYIYRYLSK